MLQNARRANPALPWPIVWLALGSIALTAVAVVVIVLVTTSSNGQAGEPAMAAGTSAARCAPTDTGGVDSQRLGADAALVPAGARSVLLCRYGIRRLVAHRLVSSSATVPRLAGGLNALPSAAGAYSCPNDDGEEIIAHFGYGSGPDDPVSVELSGCQVATNGHVHRLGLDRSVVGKLAALVPWLGTIRGRVEICGGAYPGRCRTSSFTSCSSSGCITADQVAIMHSSGAQYPSVRVRRSRFTDRVEPGRYKLALWGTGRGVPAKVLATARTRVRRNRVSRVVFKISVK
jgi:hypothetical protein